MRRISYILLLFALIVSGCGDTELLPAKYKDVFSLYLVKDSNQFYEWQKHDVRTLVLDDIPLLTINSITSYNWNTHEITYPSSTKEELKKREPLLNYFFVVVANDERIYWGWFTDYASSGVCQNPVIILIPRHPDLTTFIPESIYIQRAYPGYSGNEDDPDLREDFRIYEALKNSGKLIE